MKLIAGTVKNIKRYQYDGVTNVKRAQGLRRIGSYLFIAEISLTGDAHDVSHNKVFLFQRSLLGFKIKVGTSVNLQYGDEPREYQFMDLFRGEPYLLITDQDISNHLSLDKRGLLISGGRISLFKAWTKKNFILEMLWFAMVIAGAIYIIYLLQK